MSDVEQGIRESREIEAEVAAAFRDPAALAPLPADLRKRPRLRLSERPSFGNYQCWAVWGPNTPVDDPHRDAIARRIVWRHDLDGDRTNPMRRLQRLGQAVHPSLEVTDIIFDAAKLDPLMRARPSLGVPVNTMLNPLSVALDGERYSLEIDSGTMRWLYEWFGIDADWTPASKEDLAVANWAKELRELVDALIAVGDGL